MKYNAFRSYYCCLDCRNRHHVSVVVPVIKLVLIVQQEIPVSLFVHQFWFDNYDSLLHCNSLTIVMSALLPRQLFHTTTYYYEKCAVFGANHSRLQNNLKLISCSHYHCYITMNVMHQVNGYYCTMIRNMIK